MSVQKTITLFFFNELNEKAQKIAIHDHEKFLIDEFQEFISSEMIQNFTSELKTLGFLNPKVYYSGFASQGDGLCFTSHKSIIPGFENLGEIEITKNYRYNHSYATDFDFEKNVEADEKQFINFYRRLCDKFYSELEKSFYALLDEENIRNELSNSSYLFAENGKLEQSE